MALAFTCEIFIQLSLLPNSLLTGKGIRRNVVLALHGAELEMDDLVYRTSLFPLLKPLALDTVGYFLLFKILSSPDFWNITFFWVTFYLVCLSQSFLIFPLFPRNLPWISLFISFDLITFNDYLCTDDSQICISSSDALKLIIHVPQSPLLCSHV